MALTQDELQSIKSVVFSVVLEAEERIRKNFYRKSTSLHKEIQTVRKDLQAEIRKEEKLLETVFRNLLRLEIGNQNEFIVQQFQAQNEFITQALASIMQSVYENHPTRAELEEVKHDVDQLKGRVQQ